jgi:hypothetical protein
MDLSIHEIDFLRKCVEQQREKSGGRNQFLKNLSNRLGEERQAKLNQLIPAWTDEERIAFNNI